MVEYRAKSEHIREILLLLDHYPRCWIPLSFLKLSLNENKWIWEKWSSQGLMGALKKLGEEKVVMIDYSRVGNPYYYLERDIILI